MTEVFRKLNYKSQSPILVVSAPPSFASELSAMAEETEVHFKAKAGAKYAFALAFAPMKSDLIKAAQVLLPVLQPDAVLWFAYPKLTSKTMKSDLNRDVCWETLAPFNLQANRQIAIDDDWSALRFKETPGAAPAHA